MVDVSQFTPTNVDDDGLTTIERQLVARTQQIDPKLDPFLMVAIKRAENAGENPNAVSSAGAQGFMQVKPSTRANLIAAGKLSPDADNLTTGIVAASEMAKEVGYDKNKLIAYYNGGQAGKNNVDTNPSAMPAETQTYVPRVQSIYASITGQPLSVSGQQAAADNASNATGMGLAAGPGVDAAQAVGKLTSQASNIALDMFKQAGVITHNTDVGMQAQIQSGQAAADEKTAAQARLQQGADRSATVQSSLGINSQDPSTYMLPQMFSDMRATALELQQAATKYDQSKNESFFDNPLQHIKFALFGNDYAKQANAAQEKLAALTQSVQALSTARADASSNDAAMTASIAKDEAAAQAKKELADAQVKAANLGVMGAAHVISAEGQALGGLGTSAQAATQLFTTQMTAKAQQQESQQRDYTINKDKRVDAEQQQMVTNITGALQTLGADTTKLSPAYIKTMNKQQLDTLATVANTGQAGSNPAEALDTIANYGNMFKLNGQTPVMAQYLAKMKNDLIAAASVGNPGFDKKNPNGFVGPKMVDQLEMQRNLPDTAPMQSPYHIASPKVMLQLPSIANSPIAKILTPVALLGNNVSTQQIVGAVNDAVGKGEISPADAAKGLSTYFNTAIGINNKAFNFKLMGMKPMQNFAARIDGVSSPVDMTDSVKVQHALEVNKAQQNAGSELMNAFGVFGGGVF